MLIVLGGVLPGGRSRGGSADAELALEYCRRAETYLPTRLQAFRSEAALLASARSTRQRRTLRLILLERSGTMLDSAQFARHLGALRDGGIQEVWAAVGPPDGWKPDTLAEADLKLSLGPMTLPHRLAQAVLAEQIYRALTILAGHPYHCGH